MENIPIKVDGVDVLPADQWNQVPTEVENAILSTGITLSSGDLFQLGKTISNYAANGDFYTDSGAADAYVLSVIGLKQALTAYGNGSRARFLVGNTNTGASTVNVATLGVKSLKRKDGTALLAGDITTGELLEIEYDGTDFLLHKDIAAIDTIRQVVNVQDGAVATGTTILPFDNTIPQNTEGDEYMSLAITPVSAANKLKIEVVFFGAHSSTVADISAALFQDSTAAALAAGMGSKLANVNRQGEVAFTHYMTAGTASATTFKVRAGTSSAGTTTFNGISGAVIFGGVMASSITITEITV